MNGGSETREPGGDEWRGMLAVQDGPPRLIVAHGACTLVLRTHHLQTGAQEDAMIRKLKDGQYRLYSRKKNPKTGKRRNLGTFSSRSAAEKHEREVQYFKRH